MLIFKRTNQNFIDRWFFATDKTIIACISILYIISIILNISASSFVAYRLDVSPYYFFYKHIVYIFLSFTIVIGFSFLNEKQVKTLALMLFAVSFVLIVLILLFNIEVKGARRWLFLFGFSLQPSEIAKASFPLVMAIMWERYSKISKIKAYLYMSFLYVSLVSFIILEPDLGMSVIITAIFGAIIFCLEVNLFWILLLSLVGVMVLIGAYFNFNHVRYRIDSFFSTTGKSYQVTKAIESIENGRLIGKGSGQGVFKEYLPDAHTDFIFSVAIEEYGFIFAIFIIGVYFVLYYRIYLLILRNKHDKFKFVVLTGFLAILSVQTFIHISTNISLIPTKGVTLPFVSYGGTSLLTNGIIIGFLLALVKKNKFI